MDNKDGKSKSDDYFVAGGILLAVIAILAYAFSDSAEEDRRAERKAKQPCRKDMPCYAESQIPSVTPYCQEGVERKSKYSFRWTDGALEPKLNSYRWINKSAGTITYAGDKVEFQNGFGAYTNMIYECDVDLEKSLILGVRVAPGRL